MGKPLNDPYPAGDMPWPDKEQPFTYGGGDSGDTDGGRLPRTPNPVDDQEYDQSTS